MDKKNRLLMKKIEMAYVQNGFKDQGDLSFDFTGCNGTNSDVA